MIGEHSAIQPARYIPSVSKPDKLVARNRYIIALSWRGYRAKEIARALNVSVITVYVARRSPHWNWTRFRARRDRHLCADFRKGVSTTVLGRKYRLGRTGVLTALHSGGIWIGKGKWNRSPRRKR